MEYPGPGKQFALLVGSGPVDCEFCAPHRIFVGLGPISGHWHLSAVAVIDGTRFQCLGEPDTVRCYVAKTGQPDRTAARSECEKGRRVTGDLPMTAEVLPCVSTRIVVLPL